MQATACLEGLEFSVILVKAVNLLDQRDKVIAAPADSQAAIESLEGGRQGRPLGGSADHAIFDDQQVDVLLSQFLAQPHGVIDFQSNHVG